MIVIIFTNDWSSWRNCFLSFSPPTAPSNHSSHARKELSSHSKSLASRLRCLTLTPSDKQLNSLPIHPSYIGFPDNFIALEFLPLENCSSSEATFSSYILLMSPEVFFFLKSKKTSRLWDVIYIALQFQVCEGMTINTITINKSRILIKQFVLFARVLPMMGLHIYVYCISIYWLCGWACVSVVMKCIEC